MLGTTFRQKNQFKALIYEEELDHIAGWVEEYPNLETGGDLFGFWTHSGFPVVQFVLGPGRNSKHNQTSFYQDREHLIKAGEILRNKHGLQHIGEWHSHHQMGLAEPSGGDEQTVFNALRRYNFPKFLLCIANFRQKRKNYGIPKNVINIGCFLFSPSHPRYQTGSWVVLPAKSPIRQGIQWEGNGLLFQRPMLKRNWSIEKTQLEEQPLVTTEPLQISETSWYGTPTGKAILQEIYQAFRNNYHKCEMFRNASEQIYLTFEKHYTGSICIKRPDQWKLLFPDNFPKSSPQLQVNNDNFFEIKEWNGESGQLEQIEACIQRYYDDKWRW